MVEKDGQVKSTEEQLVAFWYDFIAGLVHAPWHPEHGPFWLTKGLLKVVRDYPWENGSLGRARVNTALLPLYASFYQQHLALQRGEAQADALYGGDSDFQEELFTNIDQLVTEIFEDLNKLKDDVDPAVQKRAARAALDYVNFTAALAELNAKQVSELAPLLQLAKRHLTAPPESQYLKNSILWLSGVSGGQELLKKV